MKKVLMLGYFSICLLLLTATVQANQINYSGNINNNHTVDYFYFSLSGTGSLDLHLETFNAEFDPVMYLFVDDGDLTLDDYLARDDDGGTSAHWCYNSRIVTSLQEGSYLTAVSDFPFSKSEVVNGENNIINYVNDGSYDLVISSNRGIVSTSSAPVPEPATILLLGMGLLGLAGCSRKSFRKKA